MTMTGPFAARDRSLAGRYRQVDLASRIEGATPHALVAMLYTELSMALDVLVRIDPGDSGDRLRQHERTSAILHTLEASLDRARGGELADSLAGIYRQMRRRLLAARGGDMAAATEVRQGVASLAEAWARIAV